MESGKIGDSQITASTVWNSIHGASNARLNFAKKSGSWSSKINDVHQWLQVDFKYRKTITDILTQGRGSHQQWVKSYTLSYSDDGTNFKPYQKNGKYKVGFTFETSVEEALINNIIRMGHITRLFQNTDTTMITITMLLQALWQSCKKMSISKLVGNL